MHTNDNLFYTPRRLWSLGLVKTDWKIYLQHFTIAERLSTVENQLFQSISNCSEEMESCVQALNVADDNIKTLQMALRQRCYEQFCKLKYQVVHFQSHIKSNDFLCNKNSLSPSEWTAAIPGAESASNLCRKCNRKNETIAHVTGRCPSNNHPITARHHRSTKLPNLYVEKVLIALRKCTLWTSNEDHVSVKSSFTDNVFYSTKKTFGNCDWKVVGFGSKAVAPPASVLDFFREFH